MNQTQVQPVGTKVIRKYANRKLYDTETSKYTTLKNLAHEVFSGRDVQVIEATTKADVTGQTLLAALVEAEQEFGISTEAVVKVLRAGGLAKYRTPGPVA